MEIENYNFKEELRSFLIGIRGLDLHPSIIERCERLLNVGLKKGYIGNPSQMKNTTKCKIEKEFTLCPFFNNLPNGCNDCVFK